MGFSSETYTAYEEDAPMSRVGAIIVQSGSLSAAVSITVDIIPVDPPPECKWIHWTPTIQFLIACFFTAFCE